MSVYLFSEMDIERAFSYVTCIDTLTVLYWFIDCNPSVVVRLLPWQRTSADRRQTKTLMLAGIGW
jgi:hypothetical protein